MMIIIGVGMMFLVCLIRFKWVRRLFFVLILVELCVEVFLMRMDIVKFRCCYYVILMRIVVWFRFGVCYVLIDMLL